jgi:hypothetical protein
MTLAEIEARFLRAVDGCAGLVEEERLRCDRFLAMAGEPGVALENLRVQLVDEDAAVPRDLFAELVALGRAMGLNESYWSLLRQK